MRLADTAAALGVNFVEGGVPDPASDRPPAASSHLHDSSDQQVPALAMAATADSISYDTDMDTHVPLGHVGKPWLPPPHPGEHAASRHFPLCPGFGVDGEAPPAPLGLPTCGDVFRDMGKGAGDALKRLHGALFEEPKGATGSGAFSSLVSRQVPVTMPVLEAYTAGCRRRSLFGLPMLHPLCGAAMAWSGAMLLFDLVFTAFWVPVNVAFCLDQYGYLDAACTRTDLAGGIIYLVNILLGFQVGVTLSCGYRTKVVMDGRDAARFYVSTLTFWLDVLAVAPFIYLVVILGMGDSVARHQTVSIVSLMRLVRLFRVASIIKQLYTSSSGGELPSSWLADHFTVTPIFMALLSYLAAVLVNLYSCLLLLIAYYEDQRGKPSWMSSVSWVDVAAQAGARRWYTAVYYCITMMTTTGYADFTPKSPAEQALASVVMLNGLVMFGAVVALIGSALKRSQEVAQKARDNRKKLTDLRRWLQEGKIPEPAGREIITFFGELSARRDSDRIERDIVYELPSFLQQQVSQHVVQGLLSQCAPLAGLPLEVRELLAAHCVPLELPTGHDLFRLGDDVEAGGGGGLWVLEEGVVGAYRNKERLELPVGPTGLAVPCLLGEAAILADILPVCGYRMWTLCTERPCRIWQLRDPALRAVLQIYPSLATHLATFVRDRIMAWLQGQDDREEEGWCEVVQLLKRSFIMGPLRERCQDCYLALQLASVADGTLAQLLAAWLEMSVNRRMALEEPLDDVDAGASDFGAAAAVSWAPRAATAIPANLITPAATPEQPSSPDPSTAAGRPAFRGSDALGSAAGSTGPQRAISTTLNAAAAALTLTESAAPDACGLGGAAAGPPPTPSPSPVPLEGPNPPLHLPLQGFNGPGGAPPAADAAPKHGGGGGGVCTTSGGAALPVGLPLPPTPALAAMASASLSLGGRPPYPRRFRSDSGRPGAPCVPHPPPPGGWNTIGHPATQTGVAAVESAASAVAVAPDVAAGAGGPFGPRAGHSPS